MCAAKRDGPLSPDPRLSRARCGLFVSLSIVGGILERGLVGASSLDREHERSGVDGDRVAEQLAAGSVVAGNDACHRVLACDGLPRADLDFAGRPEPAASWGVIDLDLERLYTLQMRVLEDPRELLACGPAEPTGEDVSHRRALGLCAPCVHEQSVGPGRSGLVVVVTGHEHSP